MNYDMLQRTVPVCISIEDKHGAEYFLFTNQGILQGDKKNSFKSSSRENQKKEKELLAIRKKQDSSIKMKTIRLDSTCYEVRVENNLSERQQQQFSTRTSFGRCKSSLA